MAEKYKNKFDKLANAPIKGLISSLAVPTILSMLVSAFYNMADSFFVGKINTQSVASIGIVFSIMTLLQAIGFFLGNGSGIMISTLLGEKKESRDLCKCSIIYSNRRRCASCNYRLILFKINRSNARRHKNNCSLCLNVFEIYFTRLTFHFGFVRLKQSIKISRQCALFNDRHTHGQYNKHCA